MPDATGTSRAAPQRVRRAQPYALQLGVGPADLDALPGDRPPGGDASSAMWLLGDALTTGKLIAPEDGPVSWTAHADLAEAAAAALTTDDLDGVTPALTASEAIDLAGLAELASELSGRPIERVVVSDDQHRENLIAAGMPAPVASMFMGLFAVSRHGEFATVDPTLATLIGRPPTPLRTVLQPALAPAA